MALSALVSTRSITYVKLNGLVTFFQLHLCDFGKLKAAVLHCEAKKKRGGGVIIVNMEEPLSSAQDSANFQTLFPRPPVNSAPDFSVTTSS